MSDDRRLHSQLYHRIRALETAGSKGFDINLRAQAQNKYENSGHKLAVGAERHGFPVQVGLMGTDGVRSGLNEGERRGEVDELRKWICKIYFLRLHSRASKHALGVR